MRRAALSVTSATAVAAGDAFCPHVGRRRRQARRPARDQPNLPAMPGKHDRRAAADAGGPAGDENRSDAAGQGLGASAAVGLRVMARHHAAPPAPAQGGRDVTSGSDAHSTTTATGRDGAALQRQADLEMVAARCHRPSERRARRCGCNRLPIDHPHDLRHGWLGHGSQHQAVQGGRRLRVAPHVRIRLGRGDRKLRLGRPGRAAAPGRTHSARRCAASRARPASPVPAHSSACSRPGGAGRSPANRSARPAPCSRSMMVWASPAAAARAAEPRHRPCIRPAHPNAHHVVARPFQRPRIAVALRRAGLQRHGERELGRAIAREGRQPRDRVAQEPPDQPRGIGRDQPVRRRGGLGHEPAQRSRPRRPRPAWCRRASSRSSEVGSAPIAIARPNRPAGPSSRCRPSAAQKGEARPPAPVGAAGSSRARCASWPGPGAAAAARGSRGRRCRCPPHPPAGRATPPPGASTRAVEPQRIQERLERAARRAQRGRVVDRACRAAVVAGGGRHRPAPPACCAGARPSPRPAARPPGRQAARCGSGGTARPSAASRRRAWPVPRRRPAHRSLEPQHEPAGRAAGAARAEVQPVQLGQRRARSAAGRSIAASACRARRDGAAQARVQRHGRGCLRDGRQQGRLRQAQVGGGLVEIPARRVGDAVAVLAVGGQPEILRQHGRLTIPLP